MYSIPLYFQIAVGASNLDAGARLVPAVVGNAAAGLLCGYVIKRLVPLMSLESINIHRIQIWSILASDHRKFIICMSWLRFNHH